MNMKLLWHELRLIITILIGKILIVLCRFAKLGGTSFPGKVAEKL